MFECAICLSTDSNVQETITCGHVFHVHCIQQWLELNHSCPLCRQVCVFSDAETLVKEINTMSGFHIFYRPDKYSNEVYHKLQMIKHRLREYRSIRNKGYSADHLASDIGYLVKDVNIDMGALVL